MKLKTVLAAAVLSVLGAAPAMGQQVEKIKVGVCGGGMQGNYIKVAKYIKYMLEFQGGSRIFDVTAYKTGGSVDNLQLMAQGDCQVAVVQSDAEEAYFRRPESVAVATRLVSTTFNEHFHMICHRSLEVNSIEDLAKRTDNTGKSTVVYIGSPNSGGALTLSNLIAARSKYKDKIIPFPNEAEGKLDATSNAIRLAIQGKACAAWVKKAPDEYLVNNVEPTEYKSINILDIDDSRFGKVYGRNGESLYEFVQYSQIAPNLYEKLRSSRPDSYFSGTTDAWTIQMPAKIITNTDWEKDMLGGLQVKGLTGTAQRWARTLDQIKLFNGDFDAIKDRLDKIGVQDAPPIQ